MGLLQGAPLGDRSSSLAQELSALSLVPLARGLKVPFVPKGAEFHWFGWPGWQAHVFSPPRTPQCTRHTQPCSGVCCGRCTVWHAELEAGRIVVCVGCVVYGRCPLEVQGPTTGTETLEGGTNATAAHTPPFQCPGAEGPSTTLATEMSTMTINPPYLERTPSGCYPRPRHHAPP